MNYPRISIVTPSFNQGQFIEQTILSVINQGYPNLEYIIIDGGSTDNTVEIIQKYSEYITFWVSEKDNGQSHAINKGLRMCTGEIFNWLNSDDWYEPNALYTVAEIFAKNRYALFVSGFERHIFENGVNRVIEGTFIEKKIEQTILRCEVTQPSTFLKMETIKRIGGVTESLHFIMDGEMWIKLLMLFGQDGFVKSKTVFVNFRFHDNSKTVGNRIHDNFLIERCSIICGLLNQLNLEDNIKDYYKYEYFKSDVKPDYSSFFEINDNFISSKKLRVYFVKNFIVAKSISGNYYDVFRGFRLLLSYRCFDFFLIKVLMKIFKSIVWKSH